MAFTRTVGSSRTRTFNQRQPNPNPDPDPNGDPNLPPGSVPNCRCPAPAVQRTVRKQGANQGRIFYTCSRPMSEQCGFFEWAPPGTPTNNPAAATNANATPKQPFFPGTGAQTGAAASADTGAGPTWRGAASRTANRTAQPQPSPFAMRAQSAMGAPKPSPFAQRAADAGRPATAGSGFNGGGTKPPPINGVLRLELFDLSHVAVELPPLLPRLARERLMAFPHAEKKTAANGDPRLAVPVKHLDSFTAVVRRDAHCELKVDLPDWLLRNMRAYRDLEARREASGDVVTEGLDGILPAIMCEKLMDFQWHGVHFALKRGARCLIADDMGLGKTLQAIAIARVYVQDWPLLIICPSSLRLNWKHELLQWLGDDLDEDEIRVIMSGKDINAPLLRVNIVSYDLVRKIPPNFLKRCQFIIADESHYLKSMTALRSKAVVPMLKNCRRAILLSGTPALSRPVELFPQLHAVSPDLFPSYNDYVNRYCGAYHGRFGLDVSGSRNLPELHSLLRSSVLIRRKKDDVLTELPDKQRQVMWVETKNAIVTKIKTKRKALDSIQQKISEYGERDAAMAEAQMKALQNEMYQLTSDAKIDSVLEVCKVTAESGVKFIVFAHHASAVKAVDNFIINKLKMGTIRIDGGTPQKDRQGLCKKFQEDDKCRVAVLSITAAGVGLTLTKATVVVFAELYWNPGSLLQAEDRAHRIGQRDSVLVKYLLAKETLDESMWATVRKKLTVVGQSLTGKAGKMEVAGEKAENGDENAGDIRSFFKKRAEKKRAREENAGQQSVAHDDEVVVIDDEDSVLLIEDNKAGGSTSADEAIDLDAPVQSYPAASRDGAAPSKKKPRHQPKESLDPLDAMFPENIDVEQQAAEASKQGDVLIDADIALARRLQRQYDEESMRGNSRGFS